MLVVAALGRVGWHAHAATAVLIGLDGEFGLCTGGDWRRARSAFVPAGLAHELECGATLMATLYLLPLTGEAEAFAHARGLDPHRLAVDVGLPPRLRARLRAIHAGDGDREGTRAELDRLRAPLDGAPVDPRVAEVVARVRAQASELQAAAELAAGVGVSTSRLMHLFKADVGVSLKRFAVWERMRVVTEHVAAGDNLTMAALAAGFADSAHLSHQFRGMFGIPASRVLHASSRVRVEQVGIPAR